MAMMSPKFGGGAPMAAPQAAAGAAAPAPQPGPLAALFGPQGSSTRYDMAMGMLQNAQQAAQGTTSPALAFLTPILTSMIGAKATKDRDAVKAREVTSMTESLLGPNGSNPRVQNAIAVLQNPDAPDYLKAIAQSQFSAIASPPKGRGGRPVMAPDQAALAASSLLGGSIDPEKLAAAASVLQDPNAPAWVKEIAKAQIKAASSPPESSGGMMPLENTFEDPPLSGNWFYLDKDGNRHKTQRGTSSDGAPDVPTGTPGGATVVDGYQIQELP